jgi:4'-phosphopantetheinyl transferase EntD
VSARSEAAARPLAAILPRGAVAAEIEAREEGGGTSEDGLFDSERASIASAGESRRREFADGRTCARRALGLLGIAPVAIPAEESGAPRWPAGVVGSITHKGDYRAAAVAPASQLRGLGIDAELNDALPDGVLASIALAGEREDVERLLAAHTEVRWDRLLFSAKEAVFKALAPIARGRTGLRAAAIALDGPSGTFTARPGPTGAWDAPEDVPVLAGRWLARGGLLIVAATIPHGYRAAVEPARSERR